jgi:hypothetical protein
VAYVSVFQVLYQEVRRKSAPSWGEAAGNDGRYISRLCNAKPVRQRTDQEQGTQSAGRKKVRRLGEIDEGEGDSQVGGVKDSRAMTSSAARNKSRQFLNSLQQLLKDINSLDRTRTSMAVLPAIMFCSISQR